MEKIVILIIICFTIMFVATMIRDIIVEFHTNKDNVSDKKNKKTIKRKD